jgi:hypothetical protein
MKTLLKLGVISLLLISATATSAECNLPNSPIIPDGNVASQDELVAAQKAMKAYQGELVGYRQCLDGKLQALDPEAESSAEQTAALNARYDRSVDAEAKVAEEFNAAVRAFKARQ